ncbi:MAG TPA: T9SS type A sorting domain-containing protein, partial [Candidatus Eisenbacteria bacterium]
NTGSLAAYRVILTDVLATTLNPSTVRLDAITFGSTTLPATGPPPYYSEVQFPSRNLLLRVYATLDLPSRELRWSFRSYDLTTGQELGQGSTNGFLLPGQEGSVLFTVQPSASAADGIEIRNQATIAFDNQAPETTLPVVNTLDKQPPASEVLDLDPTIGSSSFMVNWVSNAPPDLGDFTIYVAEDTGPYDVWMQNTPQISGTYTPRPGGHTYKFYSEAHDRSGNVEGPPTNPDYDAQTYSTVAVESDGGAARLALEGALPNPARGVISVAFSLPNTERATLELIDIAGRRVARREVGSLGPGRHVVQLGASPRLRSGLYFLRLIQGERVLRARVVLIR